MARREQRPSPPLRVAIHTDAVEAGGAVRFLGLLAGAFGSSVEPVLLAETAPVLEAVLADCPGLEHRLLPPVRGKLDLGAFSALLGTVRSLRPDVLHVNCDNAFCGQYGLLAGRLARVPTLATVHGTSPAWNRRQAWLTAALARGVGTWVAVSEQTASWMGPALHLPPGRVDVIHNGVRPPLRDRPLPPATPTVGFVGRLSREKGVDVLVTAAAALPGVRLEIIGDGPERAALEELAVHLGVGDRVAFRGWLGRPWVGELSAHVVALPSRTEGLPLVLLEALMGGFPVVTTPVGGIPEAVTDGASARLVPPDHPAALASALRELLGDEAAMATLSRGARQESRRFGIEVMAGRYERAYRALRRGPAGSEPPSVAARPLP